MVVEKKGSQMLLTYYLRLTTIGLVTATKEYQIEVCGKETVLLTSTDPVKIEKAMSPIPFTIPAATVASWFAFSNPGVAVTDCVTESTSFFSSSDASTPYTGTIISWSNANTFKNLQDLVTDLNSANHMTIYLRVTSIGGKFSPLVPI